MVFNFCFSPRFKIPQKACLLDRDGVINIDHAYVGHKEEFDFVPGALDGLRTLAQAGYALVLITNQSGIGRGRYTQQEFARLSFWLAGRLARNGSPLSGLFYCPHHPEKALAPFLKRCTCRKPEPGMILAAAHDLNLDLAESVFIGDKDSDMRAAFNASVPHRILVQSDGLAPFDQSSLCTEQAKDLFSASCLLCP